MRDFKSDDEEDGDDNNDDKKGDDNEEEVEEGEGDETGSNATGKTGSSGHTDKIWYDRDDKVTTAISGHKQWMTKQRESLQETLAKMVNAEQSMTDKTSKQVELETKLLRSRLICVRLALGNSIGGSGDASTSAANASVSAKAGSPQSGLQIRPG